MAVFEDELKEKLKKHAEEAQLQLERLPAVIQITERVFRPILQSLKENYLDPKARERQKRIGRIITDTFDGKSLDRMPHDDSSFEHHIYIEHYDNKLELFISAKGKVTVKVGDHVNVVEGDWLEEGISTTALAEAIQRHILRGIDFGII